MHPESDKYLGFGHCEGWLIGREVHADFCDFSRLRPKALLGSEQVVC